MFTKEEARSRILCYWLLVLEIPFLPYCYSLSNDVQYTFCIALMTIVSIFACIKSHEISLNTPEDDFNYHIGAIPSLKKWNDMYDVIENNPSKNQEKLLSRNDSFIKNLAHHYSYLYRRKIAFPIILAYNDLCNYRVFASQKSEDLDKLFKNWTPRLVNLQKCDEIKYFHMLPLFKNWEKIAQDVAESVMKLDHWISIIASQPNFKRDLSIWKDGKCLGYCDDTSCDCCGSDSDDE